MDLDQKLGSARSGVAGVRVYDNSDIWAWRLPPMTPIRAMASGTVVGINSEEPWRCGEVRGFATRLNVQMDEPDFLQIGYVLIVPGVALGDRVATCSVIGDSLPELAACGSNFGFTAYDMRSGSRVDPFTWSVDGRSPRGLWGISDEDYARVLGQPVGAR